MTVRLDELPRTAPEADAAKVERALEALARGEMVVVADDPGRENEGDLVMAAPLATEADLAFFLRHGSGIVCAPMTAERASELELALMVTANTDTHRTAFTVTVDAIECGTGISAADRAATLRALEDPRTVPGGLRRPGHVFPLVSKPHGVLERSGHTEAAVDLVRLAGLGSVGVITELMTPDGRAMAGPELPRFAREHGLVFLTVADLVSWRRRSDWPVARTATARIPLAQGEFEAATYVSVPDGVEHVAFSLGEVGKDSNTTLVRVHSECLTGDVFGSLRCDCGNQLSGSLDAIAAEGAGVVVYLRGQEGRGIGLGAKMRAYALQERGFDTVEANVMLGLPIDSRKYWAAAILRDLRVTRTRLITHNPEKVDRLAESGIEVAGVQRLPTRVNPHNCRYLAVKRDRLGHALDLSFQDAWQPIQRLRRRADSGSA